AAATVDWYLENGFSELPKQGPHAVTVPGAVDAWCRLLEDHGCKGIADALAPAIHYAENGYVVHDRVAFDWEDPETDLSADEVAARIFLPGGQPPKAGDVHRQPELAETLRIIARKGRAGFYEGAVAEDIVGRLRQLGGLHTLDDFASTKGDYKAPVGISYK
ncbi:MAG: gamma-glutamyltransferase, partial [Mesorhizobium sp.]